MTSQALQTRSDVSGDYSLRRIQRLVWFPIGVLVAAFAVTVLIQDTFDQLSERERFHRAWSAVWNRHEALLVNEMFLAQTAAIERRLELAGEELRAAVPGHGYCLRINAESTRTPSIDRCSSTREAPVTLAREDVLLGPERLATVDVFEVARPSLLEQVPRRFVVALLLSIVVSVIVVQVVGRTVAARIVRPLFAVIEARSRDAAIAETSRMVAHDVRRPFTLLEMALRALEESATPEDVATVLRRYVPSLKKAHGRAVAMLQDVMTVGDGATAIAPAPHSLTALIEGVWQDASETTRGARVKSRLSFRHRHKASIDLAKIERVLSNIVGNALEAAPEGAPVTIETSDHAAGWLKVSVHNGGTYIDPLSRRRVFDAFYTSGKRGGTGLGLAIAKRFVEAHGGAIWCESDPVTGTLFAFTVPAGAELEDGEAAPGSHAASPNATLGGTILVVEDDPFLREAWQEACASHRVRIFDSPSAVLAELAASKRLASEACCLVTDFHFDNDPRNGGELIDELRRMGIGLPLFISSDGVVSADVPPGVRRLPKDPVAALAELASVLGSRGAT